MGLSQGPSCWRSSWAARIKAKSAAALEETTGAVNRWDAAASPCGVRVWRWRKRHPWSRPASRDSPISEPLPPPQITGVLGSGEPSSGYWYTCHKQAGIAQIQKRKRQRNQAYADGPCDNQAWVNAGNPPIGLHPSLSGDPLENAISPPHKDTSDSARVGLGA